MSEEGREPGRRRRRRSTRASAKKTVAVQRVKSRVILSDDQREEEIDAEIFQTDPAWVRVSHGCTKSIGEFEFLRIDVAVEVPCYKELIEETAQATGEAVARFMEHELDEYGVPLHDE